MRTYDFVSKYVQLLSGVTDAPEEFQETAALFLLSTAAGRKWVFKSIPESSIFSNGSQETGKLLNLWFIVIGKSRITRKTSGVMKHVIDIAKKVFGEQQMLTDAFTPESLIKQMSEQAESSGTRSETVCYWISDEIAWFFQQLKKKESYMSSADAFLSKIYDGSTYSRGTIVRGKEKVENPYLTCLLSSTEYLPTLFDELQIRLGFMNRFIYVVGERKQRKPLRTEPLAEEEKKEAREIELFLNALVKRSSITTMGMTNAAKQVYDSFEEEIEKRIANEDLGIKEGYCGQLPNLCVRLACLYRLSRMTPEEIWRHGSSVLTVEKGDVERAIDYVWRAWAWFEKVIEIMRRSKAKGNSRGTLTGKGKEIVTNMLKEGPKKRERFLQPMTNAGISHSLLDNAILRSLIRANVIKRDRLGWYSLVKDHVKNIQDSGGDVNGR